MTFTFSTTKPAAANNPSVDQPDMLQNNISTNGIIGVDHITFNAANGGNHLQVHFPGFTAPAVVNGGASDGSVIYSAAGTADATRAQIYWKNAFNVALPLSPIKAFGSFDNTGATLNAINMSASRTSTGHFTITLGANVVTGTSYAVFVTPTLNSGGNPLQFSYTIVSATSFNLIFVIPGTNFFDPLQFSVAVLQI